MKKLRFSPLMLASLALITLMPCPARANDNFSGGYYVAIVGEYISRGTMFAQTSLQPGVDFSYALETGSIDFGVWTTWDMADSDDAGDEIDPYIGFSMPVGDIYTIGFGYEYWSYPDRGDWINEDLLWFTASADVFLSPSFKLYYNFDYEYWEPRLSISYSIPMEENFSFDTSAMGSFHLRDETAFSGDSKYFYYYLSAGITWSLSDSSSLYVGAALSGNDADQSDASVEAGADYLYVEASLSASF